MIPSVSVWEMLLDQHNWGATHTVLQLSYVLPIFHSLTPAKVHVCSVESLTKPVKRVNPEGIVGPNKPPYLPAPQFGHTEAPVAVEYLPTAQSMHAAEPVAVLYFPATHAVHDTPLGPEYPVLQTQLSTPVLAVGEFVNEGHA
jgi:hypothetical protein